MLNFRNFARTFASFLILVPVAAVAAANITGTVTNRTTSKPSAGDTVTLLQLSQGMQESTQTTTDSHGHFTLTVPDEGVHLVRVTHDKANYFKPVQPGSSTVDLDVYNAAVKVKGVSNEAEVLRIQTDPSGKYLTVVESLFVKNDSNPPMTQFSANPYDFWLPEGADISGSAALAPGGMPVQAAPVPLSEKGHYTFLFPIRPGESRFQLSYKIPYTGKFTFVPRMAAATDTVAIMLPKSMSFTPPADNPYTPVKEEDTAQTYVARNVGIDQNIGFSLSGAGQLPRETDTNGNASADAAGPDQPAQSGQPTPETQNTMPGRGLQNPLDPEGNRDPWAKYKWWILGALALLLAAAAALLLRKPSSTQSLPAAYPTPQNAIPATSLLGAIKEELFALETDRLQNRVTETEYLETKAALETILRRALKRSETIA